MDQINTIWIAGTPRTGSMWTVNIVRELLNTSGYFVLPKQPFQDEKDYMNLFLNTTINDSSAKNRYVFKVHDNLRTDLQRSKYINNIRNPYELFASYYQFTKCDLEYAIAVAKGHSDSVNHYKSVPSENLLSIRHEEIKIDPINTIKTISKFLNTSININHIREIADKFSKRKVNLIISNCEERLNKKIEQVGQVNSNEIVYIDKNNIRAFDLDTGFQSGHISKHKSEDWREIFTEAEIDKIIFNLDDVANQLGYDSENNFP